MLTFAKIVVVAMRIKRFSAYVEDYVSICIADLHQYQVMDYSIIQFSLLYYLKITSLEVESIYWIPKKAGTIFEPLFKKNIFIDIQRLKLILTQNDKW